MPGGCKGQQLSRSDTACRRLRRSNDRCNIGKSKRQRRRRSNHGRNSTMMQQPPHSSTKTQPSPRDYPPASWFPPPNPPPIPPIRTIRDRKERPPMSSISQAARCRVQNAPIPRCHLTTRRCSRILLPGPPCHHNVPSPGARTVPAHHAPPLFSRGAPGNCGMTPDCITQHGSSKIHDTRAGRPRSFQPCPAVAGKKSVRAAQGERAPQAVEPRDARSARPNVCSCPEASARLKPACAALHIFASSSRAISCFI